MDNKVKSYIAATNAMRKAAVDTTVKRSKEYDVFTARWYTMIAPLNDLALSALVDTVGELRQSPKWKKKGIRKSCEDAMRLNNKYEKWLAYRLKNLGSGDLRKCVYDFFDGYANEAQKDVDMFRISVSNALLRMKYRWDVELASWVFTTYNMLDASCKCFNSYFDAAKEATGQDYSKEFLDGRLDRVRAAFKVTADSFDPYNDYPLDEDGMCQRSMQAILNKFLLIETTNKAAEYALSENPELEENDEKQQKRIEDSYEDVRKDAEKTVGLR